MIHKNYLFAVLGCLVLLGCEPARHVPPTATVPVTSLPTKTTALMATVTLTLSPTETQTSPPTLEPEQAEATIKELLWNNPDCLAPCFMGIVPDRTTLEEARVIFMRLGLDLEQTAIQDNKEFYAVGYKLDSGLSFRVRLLIESGIVKSLDIPFALPQDQPLNTPRELALYSVETLINQYGSPSKVDFFVHRPRDLNASDYAYYTMVMRFDTVDFIVQYSGADLPLTDFRYLCPLADKFKDVRIFLGKNLENPPLAGIPLEQATTLTLDEFSKLMTGDPDKACFIVKGEVFP